MALEGGSPAAMRLMSDLYTSNYLGERDLPAAFRWMKKAAETGEAEAQQQLAWMYRFGTGVEEDRAEALVWMAKAAAQGHPEAMHKLGENYERGEGVSLDLDKAEELFEKAAKRGHDAAEGSLAALRLYRQPATPAVCLERSQRFFMGKGVPKVGWRAERWARKGAEQGDAEAQFQLAYAYEGRSFSPIRFADAFTWMNKAAEQGHVRAQFRLAYLYEHGQGTEKDLTQAAVWLRRAADQGSADAKLKLGRIYDAGGGVLRDEAEALAWWREALEAGKTEAHNRIGRAYARGRGVDQDLEKAREHFSAGAAASDAEAEKSQESLDLAAEWEKKKRAALETGDFDAGLALQVAATVRAGEWVPRDIEGGAALLEKAGAAGTPEQKYQVGLEYLRGPVGVRDRAAAIRWLRAASDAGYPAATARLAVLLWTSRPRTEEDAERGSALLAKAYSTGDPAVLFCAGVMMVQGDRTAKNEARGHAIIQKVADAGYDYGKQMLGFVTRDDPDTREDHYNRAFALLQLRDGNPESSYNLGIFSRDGRGTPRDPRAAADYFRFAASKGFPPAMARLSELYSRGEGVLRSPRQAKRYLERATAAGYEPEIKTPSPSTSATPSAPASGAETAPPSSAGG